MTSWLAPDLFAVKDRRSWPFGDLQPQSYGCLMIDCPWHFNLWSALGEEKSPQAQYRTMSLEQIELLPVGDLAREDCLLLHWCTAPMFDEQVRIMKRWGFRFVTSGVWVKTTATGKLAFGTGYVLRNCHEPFVIGAKGEPKVAVRDVRSVIMAQVREHSRKPDQAYDMMERMLPNARRADLFARQSRPGWESWGYEAGKFDGDGDVA